MPKLYLCIKIELQQVLGKVWKSYQACQEEVFRYIWSLSFYGCRPGDAPCSPGSGGYKGGGAVKRAAFLGPMGFKQLEGQFLTGYHQQGTAQRADQNNC